LGQWGVNSPPFSVFNFLTIFRGELRGHFLPFLGGVFGGGLWEAPRGHCEPWRRHGSKEPKEPKEPKNKKYIVIYTQNLYYISEPDGVGGKRKRDRGHRKKGAENMANITKTQVKTRAKKIAEKIDEVLDLLRELAEETRNEADEVEPYGDNYDLTEAQEERVEWLNDQADILEDQADELEQVRDNVEEVAYN